MIMMMIIVCIVVIINTNITIVYLFLSSCCHSRCQFGIAIKTQAMLWEQFWVLLEAGSSAD